MYNHSDTKCDETCVSEYPSMEHRLLTKQNQKKCNKAIWTVVAEFLLTVVTDSRISYVTGQRMTRSV